MVWVPDHTGLVKVKFFVTNTAHISRLKCANIGTVQDQTNLNITSSGLGGAYYNINIRAALQQVFETPRKFLVFNIPETLSCLYRPTNISSRFLNVNEECFVQITKGCPLLFSVLIGSGTYNFFRDTFSIEIYGDLI